MTTFTYPCKIDPKKAYDGDSICSVTVDLGMDMTGFPDKDLGFNIHVVNSRLVLKEQDLRLFGIDTPEMKPKTGRKAAKAREKKLAIKARDFIRDMLGRATLVEVESMEKPEKWGRVLARIYTSVEIHVTVDGERKCLNDELVAAGLARKYDGGTKQKW